jgi:uncharacterized protein (DUF2141 family)
MTSLSSMVSRFSYGRGATWVNVAIGSTLLVSVALPYSLVADPARSTLSADVRALRSEKGRVGCALYASERGFPKDRDAAVETRWCDITSDKTASCQFDDVVAGTYAIACFHDENNNGKLDANLLGIPTEGVGVSNDAKGFMGPPKFKDAAFSYSATPSYVPVHVVYF